MTVRFVKRSLGVGGAGETLKSTVINWPMPAGLGFRVIEIEVATGACALMGTMTKKELATNKLKTVNASKTALFILLT